MHACIEYTHLVYTSLNKTHARPYPVEGSHPYRKFHSMKSPNSIFNHLSCMMQMDIAAQMPIAQYQYQSSTTVPIPMPVPVSVEYHCPLPTTHYSSRFLEPRIETLIPTRKSIFPPASRALTFHTHTSPSQPGQPDISPQPQLSSSSFAPEQYCTTSIHVHDLAMGPHPSIPFINPRLLLLISPPPPTPRSCIYIIVKQHRHHHHSRFFPSNKLPHPPISFGVSPITFASLELQ